MLQADLNAYDPRGVVYKNIFNINLKRDVMELEQYLKKDLNHR
jgi:hypothetical protein